MVHPTIKKYTETSALAEVLENTYHLKKFQWHELDLNRSGIRLSKAQMTAKGIEHPHVGFVWNDGDAATELWYPQGISGLRTSDGTKKYVVVSWYGKGDYDHKGVRISLADVTDMDHIQYRHALLVEPANGLSPSPIFKPVEIHAGGLATRSYMLYVADTGSGVRVFDTRCFFEVLSDDTKEKCGILNGKAYAFDYRYILPQTGKYQLEGSPRFSFASIDWTDSDTPELLLGNYHRSPEDSDYYNPPPTIAWWQLNGTQIGDGTRLVKHLKERMQGAFAHGDCLWLSCSGTPARLYVSRYPFKTYKAYSWPHGCEDLHHSPYSDNFWCLTEYPNERMVFAVKREDYQAG